MTNYNGRATRLSSSEARFFSLLDDFDGLSIFWDKATKSCDIDALNAQMGLMSHGEKIIAQFFLGIWTRNNNDFNIFDAAAVLGESEIKVIISWVKKPFWP